MGLMDELRERKLRIERALQVQASQMDRTRAKLSLPLLSTIKVASPCNERWDDMQGDDISRHCARCDKDVFDLSEMTTAQAESLLRELGEDLCVQFYRRKDGTVLTSDCSVGQQRRRKRKRVAAALIAGLMAVGIGSYMLSSDDAPQATTAPDDSLDDSEEPERERRRVMGLVVNCPDDPLGC